MSNGLRLISPQNTYTKNTHMYNKQASFPDNHTPPQTPYNSIK
jgi:hypothetical protein